MQRLVHVARQARRNTVKALSVATLTCVLSPSRAPPGRAPQAPQRLVSLLNATPNTMKSLGLFNAGDPFTAPPRHRPAPCRQRSAMRTSRAAQRRFSGWARGDNAA